MKEITALQYQKLLFELPNPTSLIREGRLLEVNVSYLTDPINGKNYILGRPNEELSEMAKAETITFQLILNQSIPYWQPKEAIKIVPSIDKELPSIFR